MDIIPNAEYPFVVTIKGTIHRFSSLERAQNAVNTHVKSAERGEYGFYPIYKLVSITKSEPAPAKVTTKLVY